MQRIVQRDQQALETLYQRYANLVYNMAYQVLQNRSAAEEVTQDIFFQVWRWPEKWDPDRGRFTSWLLTITRHTAIDRLRRENRRPTLTQHSLDDITHLLPAAPSHDNHAHDNGRLLRSLLSGLPADQRQVILLAFYRGLTHTEIADQLGVPVGTVKSRLRLGLTKLRRAWKKALEREL